MREEAGPSDRASRDWGLESAAERPRREQFPVAFTLTVVAIWVIPWIADAVGWSSVSAFLAPGAALGARVMQRLKSLPEAARLAGGLD